MSLKPWLEIEERTVFKGRVFSVNERLTHDPRTGKAHHFHIIDSPHWVNIVAITPDEQVVLVRQYRHGLRTMTLEIPGGIVDPHDADFATAAARELKEETGYVAKQITLLGETDPNPAIQNNRCYTFLATDVVDSGKQEPDGTEDIEVVTMPIADIPDAIRRGDITHTLVITAFYFYFSLGDLQSSRR